MDATEIVYISAEVIVGVITVVGNCLVLAAIVKTRRLHTITNVFVGNLAIADIAVGVLVAPCAALSFMGLPNNFYGCVFINCLILMFTNISILMLLSVAIERFLAIKEPFLYHRLLTVRRAIVVNVFVWILGIVLGLMPMYGWHGGYRIVEYCRFTEVVTYQYMVYFQFFGLVLLPLFLMLCIYIYILIIVRRHLRQTNALHNRFQQNNPNNDGFNKDVRAAKMFALVILLFGIFWFPVNIFNCVSLFCGSSCNFPKQALLAAIVMSHANSSINPFLYATSNSRIKGAIKGLFGINLSQDERSSTDHNNIRHATTGTPRARENIVAPIFKTDDSPYKDDVRSNAVSPIEFVDGIAKMSTESNEQLQDGDNIAILNNIKHAINNNDIRHSFNVNSQSHDHSPHSSHPSLSSLANADTLPNSTSLVSQHSRQRRQQYLQTDDSCHQVFVTLSISSPPSPPLHSHSHYQLTDISSQYNGQSNLAFVNGESLNNREQENDPETNCDKGQSSQIRASSNTDSEVGDVQPDNVSSKKDAISCWKSSGSPDIWKATDKDTVEPASIYRKFSKGPYHSLHLTKVHEPNPHRESTDVLMVKEYQDSVVPESMFKSLTDQRTVSTEELELPVSVDERTDIHCNGYSKIQTGDKVKITPVKASVFVDEYGRLRNAKTEHTKL